MKFKLGSTAAAMLPFLLVACGGELEKSRNIQPAGSEFDKALYQGYMDRAEHEYGYGHYQSSDAFALKARAAASGQSVEPFAPNDDAYPPGRVPEGEVFSMQSGRQALMEALAENAKSKAPLDAAAAQVNYDCWVEEQSFIGNFFEAEQPGHVQACRDAFEAALARAQEAIKPPPAPEPEPAPEPVAQVPTSYLVFFDWDSAVLTGTADQVIREAAANFAASGRSRIEVVGHADTSGPTAYNSNLSRERALRVVEALVLQGMREDSIDVSWKGESEPLVSTGDGVREPQNRRSQIVFN